MRPLSYLMAMAETANIQGHPTKRPAQWGDVAVAFAAAGTKPVAPPPEAAAVKGDSIPGAACAVQTRCVIK
jgi:hypothetical protein